jgi:WD40 repeat protein
METQQRQAALQGALAGDAQALDELLRSFRPFVEVVVNAFLRKKNLPAQGENQELIEHAVGGARSEFAGFTGKTLGEFVAWLRCSIARSVGRSPCVHTGQYPEPPPSVDLSEERARRITDAFAQLPLDCQLVLLGRHVDGMAPAVLAERLGCDAEAIGALYVRAVCELRDAHRGLPRPAPEPEDHHRDIEDSPMVPSAVGLPAGLADLLSQALIELRSGQASNLAAFRERHRATDANLPPLLETLSDLDAVLQEWRLDYSPPHPAAATRADEGRPLPPPAGSMPEQVGRYLILLEVAGGGMGIVYKAQDPLLNRIVAVKVPRAETILKERARWVRRFLREAQSAARVRHPHVCPIFDMGEHDAIPYVVMAFIDGSSLAERLRAGASFDDPVAAVRLARQVAEGLEAIHAQGLIHRDLKPGNILIDRDGQAIVTDFGLVLPEQDSEHLTASGAVAGTPAFMAPEQASGQGDRIGPWTDLYSLGVVLYRLLTGRLPFTGPPTTVLWKIVHEKPPPLSDLRPNLDRALDAIVQKAMAARPEDRYPSARHLIEALDDWLSRPADPEPQAGIPMAAAEADAGPPRSRSTLTGESQVPVGPTLVAASAGTAGAVLQPPRPVAGRWRYATQVVVVAAALLVGLLLCFALLRPGKDGPPGSTQRGPGDGESDLAVIKPEPPALPAGAPLSPKALVTRPAILDGVQSWTVETRWPRGAVFAVAYRPDGKQLAAAGDDGMVRLWDPDTRRLLRLLVRHSRPIRSLAWSPRGQFLASAGADGAVCLWEAASGRLLRTWQGHTDGINAVAWSPGGEYLATGGADGRVRLWRTLDGSPLPAVMSHDRPVLAVAWSPDGRLLASAGEELAVRLWEVSSGKAVWALSKHEVPKVTAVAWSADGTTLASAGLDGKVWLWDVAAGKSSGNIEPRFPVSALAWSARRGALCTGSVAGVQTWDASGRLLQTLGRHQGVIQAVAWSPDGAWVASADDAGVMQFWDNDRPSSAMIPAHPAGRAAVAWSPDGRTLAIAGFSDKALRLWDAGTRKFSRLPVGEGLVEAVLAWSPDGKTLATAVEGGKVQLGNIAGGAWLPLCGHTSQVLSLAWSPKGKALASASADGSVRLWAPDTAKGRPLFEGRLGGAYAVAWSQDGEMLACGTYQKVEIWRREGNKPIQVLDDFTGPVYAVGWSPDGQLLATADGMGEGAIRFWKAGPWGVEWTVEGHKQGVYTTAWAGDGERLACGGADTRVRLVHGRTGRVLGGLGWHAAPVRSLSWRAATDTLTTAGDDGTVRVGTTKQPQAEIVIVPLRDGGGFLLNPAGEGIDPGGSTEEFVVVVRTDHGMEILSLPDFEAKFHRKHGPPRLHLDGD